MFYFILYIYYTPSYKLYILFFRNIYNVIILLNIKSKKCFRIFYMYIGEKLIFYQIMLESNAINMAFCYNLRKNIKG
nr:MAG TPA: hypothetical protein [Caudoviricetes sp.]